MNSNLRVDRVTTIEQLDALAPEWRELEVRAGLRLPFSSASWACSWWRHFAESRLYVHDRLHVRAVRALPDGLLVGVAPMMITERPSRGPLRLRVLQFFGQDPNLTELRTVLCEPLLEGAVYQALARDVASSPQEWDWVVWTGLKPGSEAETAVVEAGPVTFDEMQPNYILPLPADWDTFRSALPRNIKQSLRKCYNSLQQAGHSFQFVAAQTPAEIDRALTTLFQLHESRAADSSATYHANAYASPRARQFMREVCADLALRGQARVYELRIGGATVASRAAFVSGNHLFLYYSGFDPTWSRFSVMTTLVAEAIKGAILEGRAAVNLSFGRDESKLRWRPIEVPYRSATQISSRPRSRVLRATYNFAGRALQSRLGLVLARKLSLRRSFVLTSENYPD